MNAAPKTLFYLCKRKIAQIPELEKVLLQQNLALDFEFTYEKILKNILHTISTPYFTNNKSFERYFRKLVQESLVPEKNYLDPANKVQHFSAQELLLRVQLLLEKIKSFKKIFGVVADVFKELLFLENELLFMLSRNIGFQ